jgi:hypothetical protein
MPKGSPSWVRKAGMVIPIDLIKLIDLVSLIKLVTPIEPF